MATVNLNIGGLFQPTTETVDQSQYDGNTLLNVNALSPNTTLNINNATGSDNVLELKQTVSVGLLSTSTINLGEDAHVKLTGLAGINVGSTFNYNLSEGSTLEMTSSFLSLGVGNKFNIDLGEDATSTLIYDPTGINLQLSDYPTITGVTAGDQIQVVGATSGEYVNGDLVFKNNLGFTVGRFNAEGLDPTKLIFEGGTMTYACYLKGTHIATPEGEVKVETLKAGDKVLTASGGVATVKWLGHRTLHKSRIPAKDAVRAFPILFKKDAIASNVPHRDLTLSPGHHVSFNGTLVPAMMLVNGQTIVQQFDTQKFEYFHVELEQFDIMLAEGVPAESYVDTGNRNMFQNAAEVAMNPDFGPAEGRPVVEGITVAQQGPVVEAIRKQLLVRAEAMTGAVRTTDAALCIEVNGQIVHATPAFSKEGVYRFALPANAGDVRVLSRAAVVRDVTPLARRDLRKIGVGLSMIAITTATDRHEISLTDDALTGLNAVQDVKGTAMRWTNGAAVIPAALINSTDEATLELTVLRTYTYWVDADVQKAVRAA
ncbi:Hint domain-containing protein [Advenella mimigardefordensis]|uniref:Putative membrane protein n=1 Tax=Advenella mimigardefordensis (strain DSM 17166 / LMG 22922 / DPN7) TaxID=1247726 RepID=W0P5Y3_ADVMD|nr:Hint domain-containing protein [Advenella mimigardefordensis]AHG62166.1 putative membrane protein [Advenella mimigardefordensis DPN7]